MGFNAGIRRGAAGMRMEGIGPITFSDGPGRPSKRYGIHYDQVTRGPSEPHINDGSLVRVVGSQRRRRRRTRKSQAKSGPEACPKQKQQQQKKKKKQHIIIKPSEPGSATKIGNRLASRFTIVSYA
jgi:hypothetical protein